MKLSKSAWVCLAWVLGALLFNVGIIVVEGRQKALEFFTGYVIELSLSVDNLFVFFLIFTHYKVKPVDQGRILAWGVLGAQLMRAVFILGGLALLRHFALVVYAFGLLLVFSGYKLFFKKDKEIDLDQNFLVHYFNRFLPAGLSSFWIVLILVEAADLVFAVDSIPAVLAVTKDPFIVYSSNIFAILGLRAMYMTLAPVIKTFHGLHYALGIILVFVGFKMLTEQFWHMPITCTLGFIIVVLAVSIFCSRSFNTTKQR